MKISLEKYKDFAGRPTVRQICIASGPLVLTVGLGMTMGFSATLLPQLEDSTQVTKEQTVWIASMAALPMAAGSLIGGFLLDRFGRKTTHILCCPAIFLGWISILLAKDIVLLLLGRFITGICSGILGASTSVYISETSAPNNRGFLLGSISFAVSFGLFLVHLIGTLTSWQMTAACSCLIPLLSLLLLAPAPESPSWLLKKGRSIEARTSFFYSREANEESIREFESLTEKQYTSLELSELLVPEFLKPLVIIMVYIVANQWVGVNFITFYTITILEGLLGNDLDKYVAMLVVDFVRVLASVLACVLMRRCRRRLLALLSCLGTGLSLLVLSLLKWTGSNYSYLVMIALVAYIVFSSIGFIPLPWAMIGELFALKHRNYGSSISSFIAFSAFFSVVQTGPLLSELLKPEGLFLLYSMVAFTTSLFLYHFLPETKNKQLNEIELFFKSPSDPR